MEREFASLDTVLKRMNEGGVAFVGPRGSGKTTTLIRTYEYALGKILPAVYIDLKCAENVEYKDCSASGYYVFIDNAQLLLRNQFTYVIAMVQRLSKFCLAFSSLLMEAGNSVMRCPLPIVDTIHFVPFSRREIDDFISLNSIDKPFNEETTLPYVLEQCLVYNDSYSTAVEGLVTDVFSHILSRMVVSEAALDFTNIFQLLYSFMHLGDQTKPCNLLDLQRSGLLFKDTNGWHLVHQRNIILDRLCQVARNNHALFSKYDVGGAEELLFSDCCRRGTISAVCRGTPHTISGKNPKPVTLSIECNEFFEQSAIGDMVLISNPTCLLFGEVGK